MYGVFVSRLKYKNISEVSSEVVLITNTELLTVTDKILDDLFDEYEGGDTRYNLVISGGITEGIRTKVLWDDSILIATYTNKGWENIK